MRRTFAVAAAAVASLLALAGTAQAAETYVSSDALGTVKTGTDTKVCSTTVSGWCTFTRASGTVRVVDGAADTPAGQHLELSTPTAGTSDDKAFAFEYDNRGADLDGITTLSYSYLVTQLTADLTATPAAVDWAPAMNVEIDPNGPGVDGGYAVLVFEPVYVDLYKTPTTRTWTTQTPTASAGGWWVSGGGFQDALQQKQARAGYGHATWAEVRAFFPDATVLGIGVNQGGGNGGLTSQVDLLTVNDTTYDFGTAPVVSEPEPEPEPAKPLTADDCKNGGWKTYTDPDFPNQGQCIQFVNTGKTGQGSVSVTPKPSVATVGKIRAA
ncbi:hypothetical protein [Geodermatophilus sp. URMC 64]